ncbi:MAG TPA: mechanosensitive ion channel [Bacteroidetes bacterium]|nr:mechanosensitive ion channel [Bacteroidota bacterium]
MTRLEEFLSYRLIHYNSIDITVLSILKILLVIIVTKIILVFIRKAFFLAGKRRSLDEADWSMFYILIKYFIYLLGFTFILNIIGVDVTMLIAGSSALLIGLGIGIKQYLYDLFSGMILLFERKINIGDIIELEDGKIVKITDMGMRFSLGVDRDDVIILIPNSNFISDKIIFWKQHQGISRFRINVGVAYGSDTELVSKTLIEAALMHKKVSKKKTPIARLVSFGDSSLDFQLLFWSNEKFRIEQVKSEINFNINKLFNKNGITIPFPQRDVHMK